MKWIIVALLLALPTNAFAITTNSYARVVFASDAANGKSTGVCPNMTLLCTTTTWGKNFFNVDTTARPAGATTQWMTFWFYSEGYFAKQTSGHVATSLFGRYSGNLSGRGALIGNTSGKFEQLNGVWTLTGCANPNRSQFESYWQTGNHTFPNSCSSFQWADKTWYAVGMHVTVDGWMSYEVRDINGNSLYYAVVHDTWNPENIAANSGFWLAQVLDDGGKWRILFDQVTVGWY